MHRVDRAARVERRIDLCLAKELLLELSRERGPDADFPGRLRGRLVKALRDHRETARTR